MTALRLLAWSLAAVNLVGGIALVLDRGGGDAATRGLDHALGMLLLLLALASGTLAWWGGRGGGRGLVLALACLVGSAPIVLAGLFLSQRRLAGLYPGLRDVRSNARAPQYRFRDAATRRAARALVHRDHDRLDALLRASPAPVFTARDELGQTLLGVAAYMATTIDASTRDVAIVERLLAMGARPQPDDLGPGDPLIEWLAIAPGEHAAAVLDLLLAAGLDPDTPSLDGRTVLFHPFLQPDAARVLIRHGADRYARDPGASRHDWSPVTVAAFQRHWATAVALLEGGVPPDYATPAGSLLAQVIQGVEPLLDAADRADPGYRAFMAAAGR